MKYCYNCGHEIEKGYAFCPECGADLQILWQDETANDQNEESDEESVFIQDSEINKTKSKVVIICPNCHSEMPVDDTFCRQCGKLLKDNPQYLGNTICEDGQWKNKWVSLLLCIFLGVVGAHKFYEGKIGMGILYICTFGLLGYGVIVDIIRIALKPNPYWVTTNKGIHRNG